MLPILYAPQVRSKEEQEGTERNIKNVRNFLGENQNPLASL